MIVCGHDTAVVVLSYNGKMLHKDFFPALIKESKGNYDVVLIDNASTDDTLSYVQQNFPEVKTIRLAINRGFANGYYEGLKQIQAKYYVLLSADFEITSNWYKPLYQLMEKDEKIAACQPKIKYYKDKTQFEYAGAGGGFMDKWGYMFCRGRIFFDIEKDEHQYDDSIEVFWASGGCFFVRSEVYNALGGLDNELYAHMEEIDMCWRMQNRGYTIAYCGESTVYHIGGSVISYGSPQKTYYNYRNNLILLTKNTALIHLLWLLPLRIGLDKISAFKELFSGNVVHFMTIYKALLHFVFSFGKWYKKRDKLADYNNWQRIPIYRKSIILKYFLQQKKKFTQLDFTPKNL